MKFIQALHGWLLGIKPRPIQWIILSLLVAAAVQGVGLMSLVVVAALAVFLQPVVLLLLLPRPIRLLLALEEQVVQGLGNPLTGLVLYSAL